jgi:hypothetical protein
MCGNRETIRFLEAEIEIEGSIQNVPNVTEQSLSIQVLGLPRV